MSEPTEEQLRRRLREIEARQEEIKAELTEELRAEKPAYAMLLELETPMNEARKVMTTAYLSFLRDTRKSEAPGEPSASVQ